MARISMLVPDEDLALIDSVAERSRTAFMIEAARQEALRIRRQREDDEIARICAEEADRDRTLAADFADTLPDGL